MKNLLLTFSLFTFTFSLSAATCTWSGAWDTTPSAAEDEIVVTADGLTWSSSLPMTVASWTQSAGTVTFDTGLDEFEVTGDISLTGGEWTHTANPSMNSSAAGWKNGRGTKQLIVKCGGDFTIGADAAVHGDVKGYLKSQGPGSGASDYGQGSAHGSSGDGNGNKCYGLLFAPDTLGSGGASAAGGGAVKITCAKTLTVNGRLSADATAPQNTSTWGLASGGSVYISTKAIAGSGTISANGQAAISGCCDQRRGGGGRIAVYLTGENEVFESFTGTITAYGTRQATYSSGVLSSVTCIGPGVPGPIYIETAADTPHQGELRLVNGTATPSRNRYYVPNAAEGPFNFRKLVLSGAQLAATNGVAITLPVIAGASASSSILTQRGGTITLPRQLTISKYTYGVYLSGQSLNFIEGAGEPSVTIAGDGQLTVDYPFTVPCDLTIENGGVLRQSSNGSLDYRDSDMVKLNLSVEGDFTVDAGGKVYALGCGYHKNCRGDGSSVSFTYEPACHAGATAYLPPSKVYGSLVEPNTFGSMSNNGSVTGGGVIRLAVSGDATVNGLITANGGNQWWSSGAGGSIYLSAKSLTGSGTIQADGGNTQGNAGNTYASSGGRVAVALTGENEDFSGFTGLISAFGGEYGNSSETKKDKNVFSAAGTVYLRKGGEGLHDGTLYITNGSASASITLPTVINASMTDSEVGNVVIAHNGRLLVDTNATLTIHGDLTRLSGGVLRCLDGDSEYPGSTIVFSDATKVSKIANAETFYNLTIATPGKEIQFPAGLSTAIAEGGKLTVSGASGALVRIRSTTEGTQAELNIGYGASTSVEFADVKDSNATGLAISAKDSTDSGNNTGWSMSSIQPGDTINWTGAYSAEWGNLENWLDERDQKRLPIETDVVVIKSGSEYTPTLPEATTLNALVVEAGKTLNLGGYALTVTNTLTNAGTLNASGGETLSVARDLALGTVTGGKVNLVVGTTAEDQTLALGALAFGTITVGAGAGDVAFSGGFSADKLAYSGTAQRTLTFAASSQVTIGQLNLAGADGDDAALTISSSAASQPATVNVSGMAFVSGVKVKDLTAGLLDIYVDSPCDDLGGNNAKWHFGSRTARWIGGASGAMTDAANWTDETLPDANTRVVFDATVSMTVPQDESLTVREIVAESGTVTLGGEGTLATAGAFVMEDGAKIVLDLPLTVGGNAEIRSGATLTHSACGSSVATTNRVFLTVAGDLTVAAGGAIDATAKGWSYNAGPGDAGVDGTCWGASHGGLGVDGVRCYGSPFYPITPGSGCRRATASIGGGVVRLVAGGAFTVNGAVTANANTITGFNGTGGSIWISAGSLTGAGKIQAHGGGITDTSWSGYTSGGGRVAIYLSQAADLDAFTGDIDVGGSRVNVNGVEGEPTGGAGTLYLSPAGTADKAGTLVIDARRSSVSYGTDIPSGHNAYAVNDYDDPANYQNVKIVVKRGGKINLLDDLSVPDVDCPGTTAGFDLNNHELLIRDRTHYKRRGWGCSPAISAGGAIGRLVWKFQGAMIILR